MGWLAFDMTGGYLGITQLEGETVKDRFSVARQVKELLDFVGKRNRTQPTTQPQRAHKERRW